MKLSKDSLSNKLASAVFATSLVVSPVGAMAGADVEAEQNNNNETSVKSMSPLVAKGWSDAKRRSDYVKSVSDKIKQAAEMSASQGKVFTPKSLRNAITSNPLGGPITHKIMDNMVGDYKKKGFFGTFIGVVVDGNGVSAHQRVEEVREMAARVSVDASEYGANISGVFMVQHDPNDKETFPKIKPNDIMVYTGDTPSVFKIVYSDIEEAERNIPALFNLGWHVTPFSIEDARAGNKVTSNSNNGGSDGSSSASTSLSHDL